jgi:hypothetical protein
VSLQQNKTKQKRRGCVNEVVKDVEMDDGVRMDYNNNLGFECNL